MILTGAAVVSHSESPFSERWSRATIHNWEGNASTNLGPRLRYRTGKVHIGGGAIFCLVLTVESPQRISLTGSAVWITPSVNEKRELQLLGWRSAFKTRPNFGKGGERHEMLSLGVRHWIAVLTRGIRRNVGGNTSSFRDAAWHIRTVSSAPCMQAVATMLRHEIAKIIPASVVCLSLKNSPPLLRSCHGGWRGD